MASISRRTPVGTDIRGFGASWQISGISVDNPSGSWIRVVNVGDIPPYTMGWSKTISPKTTSVDILFVESPSGTPSELVGESVTVTIYDYPLPDHPGYASGASTQQHPGSVPLTTYDAGTVFATETAFPPITFITSVADTIIVPRQVLLSYSYSGVGFNAGYGPRTPVVLAILESGGGTFQEVWISPESPFAYVPVIDGLKTGTNAALAYTALTAPGGGAQAVHFRYEYYRITQR